MRTMIMRIMTMHAHAHHDHAITARSRSRAHDHDHAHCDHDHGPRPGPCACAGAEELAGPGGWQRGLSAIVAVGLRPCSGAILVLVFALAQGLFWAGVAATFVMGLGTAITVAAIATLAVGATALGRALRLDARAATACWLMRGIEVAAALLIIAFGALLLLGYMASERLLA